VVTTILVLIGLYLLFCTAVMEWDGWKHDRPNVRIPDNLICWQGQRGKWSVCYRIRSRYTTIGRFGAAWNWALGARMGSSAILFQLIVAELYFCWQTPPPRTRQDRKDDNA
jgi:hypothetical protein